MVKIYNELMAGRKIVQVFVRHPRFPQEHIYVTHGPYIKVTAEEVAKIREFYMKKFETGEVRTNVTTMLPAFTKDTNAAQIDLGGKGNETGEHGVTSGTDEEGNTPTGGTHREGEGAEGHGDNIRVLEDR